MIDKKKVKRPLNIFFAVFILMQPFLDTIFLYSDTVISYFGFSPSTIFRFTTVGVMLGVIFLLEQVPVKAKIMTSVYLGITILYFIAHHLAASKFVLSNGKQMAYSFFNEFFYMCRLILPVILIFITYYIGISLKSIFRLVVCVSLIMSSIIIVSNLLCVSLDSYTNETIKANIFAWFANGYQVNGFNGLASKGFFYFANQIAAIFIMLFPIVFLEIIREKSVWAGVALVAQSIAMIMLGTKISTFGALLSIAFCLITYLFFVIIRKEKWNWITPAASLIVIVLCIVLIPHSPAMFRLNVHNNTVQLQNSQKTEPSQVPSTASSSAASSGAADNNKDADCESIEPDDLLGFSEKEKKLQYIEENYKRLKINEKFILEAYPYKLDPEFWYAILQEPAANRLNNRFLEISMVQRAKELGGSSVHTLLGISYTKMVSFFNIERDIVSQYYSMGIVGVILFLGPIILLFLVALYLLFRKFQNNFNLTNTLLISSLGIVLIAGFISGNTLDNLFVTILMAVICGGLCKSLWEKPE